MTVKDKLLTKLFQGSCSREELYQLLELLQKDSGQDYAEVLDKIWEDLDSYPDLDDETAGRIMHKLMAGINESTVTQANKPGLQKAGRSVHLPRRRFVLLARVAVVLILIGAISWLWMKREQRIVVQTTFAEQKTIVLPDHSIVKMNANSTLSYTKDWTSSDTREVWLEGEAYFEVEKKTETGQKFQVKTPGLTVEVLGTTFNINARDIETEVFLEEGQIRLNIDRQEEEILMAPGEMVTYTKSSGIPVKQKIDSEAPSSWKTGTAVMKDATLEDIIQKIHEIYDVKVIVEDQAYLDREFTVFLPVDDPGMGYNTLSGLGLEVITTDNHWTIK